MKTKHEFFVLSMFTTCGWDCGVYINILCSIWTLFTAGKSNHAFCRRTEKLLTK